MKFKQKKSPNLLSDKIADALTVKPRADIEDDHVFGTKPQTVSREQFSSSDEDDNTISDFRKQNVNLLSEISKKYEGQVVSRKDLEESSDGSQDEDIELNASKSPKKHVTEDSEEESKLNSLSKLQKYFNKGSKSNAKLYKDTESDSEYESDNYSITKIQKQLNSDSSVAESEDREGSEGEESEDVEGDEEGYDISQMAEPMKEDFEHIKKQNVSEEAKKGVSIRNQLLVWEGLLEMRIHMQRCMNTANKMPMTDTYEELKKHDNFVEESTVTISNVAQVLDKLLNLQDILFKKFPETKNLSKKSSRQNDKQEKKVESDEEIPSDTDNEEIPSDTEPEDNMEAEKPNEIKKITKKRKLNDYEKDISTSHKSFKSFRDTTIQKWNDKTRVATAANIKNTPTNSVLQQISYILSDRQKLVRRSQLKRSEYDIVGYKSEEKEENGLNGTRDRKDNDEYIPEIFDDSDFYHQLLRELIECKSADISDPIQLSRQWIALQQMRSKMKRKVDTRATKGRKIKYVVHNQLVNFMAPGKSITWNDESTNELYSSLFGKLFEHNNIGLNVNLDNMTLK